MATSIKSLMIPGLHHGGVRERHQHVWAGGRKGMMQRRGEIMKWVDKKKYNEEEGDGKEEGQWEKQWDEEFPFSEMSKMVASAESIHPCKDIFHNLIANLYIYISISNLKLSESGKVTHFYLDKVSEPWHQHIVQCTWRDWTWILSLGTWNMHSVSNPVWGAIKDIL